MRVVICALLILALTNCGLPRGAALQSEIIGKESQETLDLAIYRLTKDTTPAIKKWPAPKAAQTYSWPSKGVFAADKAIQPFDHVSISVWDTEENSLLSGPGRNIAQMPDLQVSAGGTVFLPFISSVHIAGMSEVAARALIQRKYEVVVPTAQVQISVKQGGRGAISMVSGVARPGPIKIADPNFTLLNAISMAGGPSERLQNPQVKLIRGNKTYRKSFETVLAHAKYDTVLKPGDKIAIEKDDRYFRSLGAASREAIVPFTQSEISALDAMSLVGGLTDTRANPKGILILREYSPSAVRADMSGPDNVRSVFVIDLTTSDGLFSAGNFMVRDKDTVLVTESSVASATLLLTLIGRIASTTSTIGGL
jgi:polysaccharide export outer membrane protein